MGWFASLFSPVPKISTHCRGAAAVAPPPAAPVTVAGTAQNDCGRTVPSHRPPRRHGPVDEPLLPVSGLPLDTKPVLTLVVAPAMACPVRHAPPLKLRTRHEKSSGHLQPARAVRLVISGRMADVCAELERLAANEARLCNSARH